MNYRLFHAVDWLPTLTAFAGINPKGDLLLSLSNNVYIYVRFYKLYEYVRVHCD